MDEIVKKADEPLKLSASELLLKDSQSEKRSIAIKQGIAEFGGTLGAGVVGTAAFSLLPKTYSLPLRLIAAAAGGSVTKFGLKGGLELGLLNSENRTTSAKDLAWGAVDGLSGVAASAAEQYASKRLTTNLGYRFAGTAISGESALQVGEKVLQGSILERVKQNTYRGLVAGFAGSLVYSTPHALANNFDKLNTKEGILATGKEIGLNTAFGTAFGGLLSGTVTTLANSKDIYKYAKAAMQGENGVTRVDILHFNDVHSALMGERASLPQLATKADELRAAAQEKGGKALLFDLGDNYSGNVIAGSSEVGYVETAAMQKMKVDGFVPGNHVADIGFGRTDVDSWVRNMTRIRQEVGADLPAIASNIEVPKYPGFIGAEGTYKPYQIVKAANGEQIGVIGLVTRELETGSDKAVLYQDAKKMAEKTIAELNGQNINKVIVLSHMGRAEDVALAQSLKGKVSAIVGAHSHDIEPVPLWIRGAGGNDIPIVQAGSKAGWLGELNLAIKADGTADKFRTFGRLHEIGANIEPHPQIRQFIDAETSAIAARTAGTYKITDLNQKVFHDINVTEPFSMGGIRGENGVQTPLGTVVSKGLLEEANLRLPEINADRVKQGLAPLEPMTIMLKHTGDIREEMPAGIMNRLKASNVFLNTGSASRESSELASIQLTGKQLERVLNFGTHDLAPAAAVEQGGSRLSELGQKLKALVVEPKATDLHDYTGNFLMGDGVRYSYNRAATPGQMVSNVEVFDQASKAFVPVDPNKTYNILTLFHPVDKWGKVGMLTTFDTQPAYASAENWVFGTRLLSAEARAAVNAQPIPLSQVDLLVSYLQKQGGSVSPTNFVSNAIREVTPQAWKAPLLLGRTALPSMAATAGFDQFNQAKK